MCVLECIHLLQIGCLQHPETSDRPVINNHTQTNTYTHTQVHKYSKRHNPTRTESLKNMRTRIKRTHGVSDRPFSSPRLHHPEEGRVGEAGRPDRKVTSPAMWILSAILALLSPHRSHLLYIFWLRELSLKWKSTKSSIFFFPRSIWVAKCSLVFLQRAYQRSSVNHTVRSASVDEVRVSVATALSFVFPSHGGCHCSCQLPTPPLFPLTPSKPETQGVSDFSQESKVQELRRGGECFQEVFRKYSSQVNQMLQSFN